MRMETSRNICSVLPEARKFRDAARLRAKVFASTQDYTQRKRGDRLFLLPKKKAPANTPPGPYSFSKSTA